MPRHWPYGVGLLALVGCTANEGQPQLGMSEQPIVTPLNSLAPFEAVDLSVLPLSISYPLTPQQIYDKIQVPRRCDGFLNEGDRSYGLALEGSVCTDIYAGDKPYINGNPSFSYQYGGEGIGLNSGKVLQLTLPPRTQKTTPTGVSCRPSVKPDSPPCVMPFPDRAELTAYSDDFEVAHGVGFGFDNPKYFAFLMRLPVSSGFTLEPVSDGDEGVHFMQAWQYHTVEDGCGVPLVATMENAHDANLATSPIQFRVTAKDDQGSVSIPDTSTGAARWPLTLNKWHRFEFFLNPSSNELPGTGQITIWLDGQLIVDWHHDWGCNTTGKSYKDKWNLRVGMYRTYGGGGSQPAPINQRLDLLFDEVRVAPSRRLATIF
jgi:hypothetical protein